MTSPDTLAEKIRATGFTCTGCSSCCRHSETDSGLVIVTCDEIREIIAATGLLWEEIAIPYPEVVGDGNGAGYMLGWCLRHEGDSCRFLSSGRCTIYESRPWICRTYPFMFDGDSLIVSDCEGVGTPMTSEQARHLAADLLFRRSAEEEEALRTRDVLVKNTIPRSSRVVVDSEGVKVIHG